MDPCDELSQGGEAVQPTSGNTWVKRTDYASLDAVALEDAEREREAATSGLAARRGALLLDYLRATVPDNDKTREALKGWLGPQVPRGFGWRGWYNASAMVLAGGLICWCTDPERAKVQGILIDLPGKACASLGARLIDFMAWCLDVGRVVRADYALDDFDGRLTYERVLESEADGSLVMRWQGIKREDTIKRGKVQGWTLYLGSRKSEAVVRIYDKAAEQKLDGVSWVRFELETKAKLADALAREYFRKRDAQVIIGQINRRVRFCEVVPGDTNPRRWPVAGWWAELIGSIEPGPRLLCCERPDCTVSSLYQWAERQAGPALACVMRAEGGDLSLLFGMLKRGEDRLKPKHFAALNAFREARASMAGIGGAERSEAASVASRDVGLMVATA